jgi:hypothetical protein
MMGVFREVIDGEIAKIETEHKAQQERRLAEANRLKKARESALLVRDQIILPLLGDLRDDFAADKSHTLPTWKIHTDGSSDRFSARAATPENSTMADVAQAVFTIKAQAAVAEAGVNLVLSISCTGSDPNRAPDFCKAMSLHEVKESVGLLKFDESASRDWFREQLGICIEKCVRQKMSART